MADGASLDDGSGRARAYGIKNIDYAAREAYCSYMTQVRVHDSLALQRDAGAMSEPDGETETSDEE